MKTDRELLEAAARAAKMPYAWNPGAELMLHTQPDANALYWRPLDDDGDALRLSVKTGEPFVVRRGCVTTMGGLFQKFDPSVPGDDLRATRRIIVRAAAMAQKE